MFLCFQQPTLTFLLLCIGCLATRWAAECWAIIYIICVYEIVWAAESIKGDANRMAVCGESAGGTMSLVMSMLAKQHQQPSLIKAQVPLCPATDLFSFNSPSYEDFADDEFEVR